METKLSKREYMRLIEEDIDWLNTECPSSLERDHIKAVLCGSIDLIYPTQLKDMLNKRVCPYCGSTDVIMFDSDNDLCNSCRKYFPGT